MSLVRRILSAASIGLLLIMTGVDGAVHAHTGACPGGHCDMATSDHARENLVGMLDKSEHGASHDHIAHDHTGVGDDGCGPFTCHAAVLPAPIDDDDFAALKIHWAAALHPVATPVTPDSLERPPNT
ncbi:hypothetical protein PXK00_17885 [Phaeobacter sp. QD34_3]|uniref:hypothetical protein n=1 Tax=unclassified Phaeobacter TaxID=2621772 RepID=UPI00237F2065|nr:MULTISPECIES: hypothetical protein [unclassified Phaeobacter]MDE4134985.1 hypothetical protein [Phaeobacter sp. QD34_3]MDE4138615.1 hypothetical protein [Phaeobacter sp. QD34_24]